MDGNEAIARGALLAGCRYFFGYPITPQNEIPEFMARELPKVGGIYLQSESETASVYMLYGGALTGERVMTSTSSPGFSLMQEGISYMMEAEVSAVIVDVMRMGPGIGTGGQQGQTDYRQVTKGGGHGGYHCIVLAPNSAQECLDLMQLAFYLADKYRIVAIVLADFILGRMAEMVEIRTLDFGPLPEKDWALRGKASRSNKRRFFISGNYVYGGPHHYHQHMMEKYQGIMGKEIKYETNQIEGAELLLVAYGSSARLALKAIEMARAKGLKVGLFRPITLWPFPEEALGQIAWKTGQVLVVEDSPGELIDDVRLAVQGRVPVHHLGVWGRYTPKSILAMGSGIIYPEKVLQEIEVIYGN